MGKDVRIALIEFGRQCPELIPHGTDGYSNYKCRCRECKDAWSAYMRGYRKRRMAAKGEGLTKGRFRKKG